jgi:hypothetical protein
MVAFLFAQPFAPPPPKKIHPPPKEGYLPHPPPERLQKEARSQRLRIIPVTFMHPPARHSSRLGQRFQLALGAAAALAAISLSQGSAQAFVVTVNSVQYDVTTFTGSYNDNTSKFETAANNGVMPWWGSQSLAGQFAAAVAGGLGFPNGISDLSPFFGYRFEELEFESLVKLALFAPTYSESGLFVNENIFGADTVEWAQVAPYTPPAAPAPGPLPLFGAAAAFGFSRKLRKRIQLAPNALGSALPRA